MKIKRINMAFLLLALAGMALTGCGNEDLANVNPQEKETGNVSFSIVEKDYEPATDNPKTRAAAEETKTITQDLGDGLMAEVSLVPDTTHISTTPKTRAINKPTHYTIQAFQGGVKKGELKGTFNGSTFTPDTGQPEAIGLPHGTYDFVCFNDGVTSNGTQLTVNRSAAATARFTVKRGVTINQDPKQQVEFTLKHAGAIVSYILWAQEFWYEGVVTNTQTIDEQGQPAYVCDFANEEDRIKYKIESAASTVPSTMVYDFATDTYSYPTTEQISKSANAVLGTVPLLATPGGGFGTDMIRVPADYYLPSTNSADMKLTFTHGKTSGVNLTGKSITIPTSKLVEANKVYRVLVRFYLTDRYVYSDGTYGPRSQNSTKTPIAVIVSDNVAIALHDVNEGGAEQLQWGSNTTSSEVPSWYNTCMNYADLFDGNQYGQATQATGAAKSAVSGYTPAAPSGRRWIIPTLVDFLQMGITLGRMTENNFWDYLSYSINSGKKYAFFAPSGAAATGFSPAPSTVNFPAMDMTRFNNAFTNVGGTPPSGTYWTYMECKDGTEYKMATIEISGGKFHLGLKSKTETAKVRPVILYR